MLGSEYFDKQTEDKLLPVNVVDAQIHILRLTCDFSIAFYERFARDAFYRIHLGDDRLIICM